MPKQQRKRVMRPQEQRSPEQVRRIGRALIALAQAQLEAEAQADAEGRSGQPTKSAGKSRRPTGDAR